jgi:hypothetical protein
MASTAQMEWLACLDKINPPDYLIISLGLSFLLTHALTHAPPN